MKEASVSSPQSPVASGFRSYQIIHEPASTPIGDELVTYELKRDPKGRLQGADVTFVGHRAARPSVLGQGRNHYFSRVFPRSRLRRGHRRRLPTFILWLYLAAA
jgi:hypothetical protein